mmetsp:Transcript_26928/g.49527  ORF Transcript_26928/g.49527 Transcript_26928/m.49527 type:complete len:503 (-) Transcript_26928:83-1591(-)
MLRLEAASRSTAERGSGMPQPIIAKAHRCLLGTASKHLLRHGGFRAAAAKQARGTAREKTRASERALKEKLTKAVPLALFSRLCRLLDSFSWELNGACLPSPLGRYCEEMCAPSVSKQSQAEMLLSIGPVLKELCEQQDKLDSDAESSQSDNDQAGPGTALGNDVQPSGHAALSLPAPEAARLIQPVLLKGLLSEAELSQLRQFSSSLSAKEHLKYSNGTDQAASWRTRYLHADSAFGIALPELQKKLVEAALQADVEHWHLATPEVRNRLRIRCIEHHLVSCGGALPDPTHFDGGSAFTLDVMLTLPGSDFTGGEFSTMEADGHAKMYGADSFSKGDALVFVSHKPHFVKPVTSGLRETLVLELWDGVERKCNHRCPSHSGVCPLEAQGNATNDVTGDADGVAGPGVDALQHALSITERDASGAFAATAFEGHAFYMRVASIHAQSQRAQAAQTPNVAVTFEDVTPVATVRALRRISAGEIFIAKTESSDDEEDDSEAEEM